MNEQIKSWRERGDAVERPPQSRVVKMQTGVPKVQPMFGPEAELEAAIIHRAIERWENEGGSPLQ